MADITVAVLTTLDTKCYEAQFVCESLAQVGVKPWLIDISLRPHELYSADVNGGVVAKKGDSSWSEISQLDRTRAAEIMILGGRRVLLPAFRQGDISGAIGLGGANGTSMACAVMRTLPPIFPKVMVTPVAATAAVEWYVAESDIIMFSSIGDISLNRITRGVIGNAVEAVAAMARKWDRGHIKGVKLLPLVGISTFGVTEPCVQRVNDRLIKNEMEVIQFHASGPGGKALENLASKGVLSGIVDITTHELADHLVGGVYSAGDIRLSSAERVSIPRVIVPGGLDFINFWVGSVPTQFSNREFLQFNAQNILMRTNGPELELLGRLVAEKLNQAKGPFAVLIPMLGFSQNTSQVTRSLSGDKIGDWAKPDIDYLFTKSLRKHLKVGQIKELNLHINDPEFADACVDIFLNLWKELETTNRLDITPHDNQSS